MFLCGHCMRGEGIEEQMAEGLNIASILFWQFFVGLVLF